MSISKMNHERPSTSLERCDSTIVDIDSVEFTGSVRVVFHTVHHILTSNHLFDTERSCSFKDDKVVLSVGESMLINHDIGFDLSNFNSFERIRWFHFEN